MSQTNANQENTVGAPTWKQRFWVTLDERLGLGALNYPIPKHGNTLPYMLGGITFFGFVFLILSGIFLTQYYHPHPDEAHQSVVYIIERVPLGDFIRGIHFWLASLVFVTILLHVIRVFTTGTYKKPREANWLIGLGLLTVTVGFIFSGTVLKWDQEGYEAMIHNMAFAQLLGVFGGWFSQDFSLSVPMLTRLYTVHIAILPALFTLLLLAHMMLVKYHGVSPRAVPKARSGTWGKRGDGRFSTHLRRMSGYGLWLLALAGGLALIWPAFLGFAPVTGAEVTKPPWMFWWLYAFENWGGAAALLWVPIVFFGLLALVPWFDRSPYLAPRQRPVTVAVGIVVLLALVALSIYVGLAPAVSHIAEGM